MSEGAVESKEPKEPVKVETNAEKAVNQKNTVSSTSGKALTNKELKELKKKEKAAKRAANKQSIGISLEK